MLDEPGERWRTCGATLHVKVIGGGECVFRSRGDPTETPGKTN